MSVDPETRGQKATNIMGIEACPLQMSNKRSADVSLYINDDPLITAILLERQLLFHRQ